MSAIVLVFVAAVWGADPGNATESSAAEPRRFNVIDDDIRAAMRAEATASNESERAAAVRRLAALHDEIRQDPRLESSDTLKGYKAKLWSKLTRVKTDLQRQIDRERKSRRTVDGTPAVDEVAIRQATDSVATQMSMLHYTLGGPANVLAHGGGAFGGRPANDHGQELIDLIERTIRPNFWDTNGGPGSMFYYQPLMALVVRATSEVHGDVGGVLEALRRAGN